MYTHIQFISIMNHNIINIFLIIIIIIFIIIIIMLCRLGAPRGGEGQREPRGPGGLLSHTPGLR